jgi:Pyruvate/2-oxoacid:ferredoxin oxidoreductase gamma subunit
MESQKFEEGIRRIFSDKGENIVEANLKAFKAGQAASL